MYELAVVKVSEFHAIESQAFKFLAEIEARHAKFGLDS